MCYREGVEIKFILKIKQNFMDNPLVALSGNDIRIEGIKDAANGENEDEDEENEGNEGDFKKIWKSGMMKMNRNNQIQMEYKNQIPFINTKIINFKESIKIHF